MTWDEFTERLVSEVGEQFNDHDVKYVFRGFISEAAECLWSEEPSGWQFAVTSDTRAVDTSTGEIANTEWLRFVFAVYDDNDRPLRGATIQTLLARSKKLAKAGSPTHFYRVEGGAIRDDYGSSDQSSYSGWRVWPVPSSAENVTIWYLDEPPDLTKSGFDYTDRVRLPADAVKAIKDYARALYYENAGNTSLADRAIARYEKSVRLLRSRYTLPSYEFRDFRHQDVPGTAGRVAYPYQLG